MKDNRVRYNPAEKSAIIRYQVRCFCLTRQDLVASAMTDRFLNNLQRIAKVCADPGPFATPYISAVSNGCLSEWRASAAV
jgi:hypothetical protein